VAGGLLDIAQLVASHRAAAVDDQRQVEWRALDAARRIRRSHDPLDGALRGDLGGNKPAVALGGQGQIG
jgi:hypothetical protein